MESFLNILHGIGNFLEIICGFLEKNSLALGKILNKVLMEKAPEHLTIHLMTSIQLSTPHKPITILLVQPTNASINCKLSPNKLRTSMAKFTN